MERTLGAGGMGLVFAATHLELDRLVAIKILLPHMLEDETVLARFMREGKLASKIASDHVARVLDVGRAEDGSPFMVMEYLEGQDLMAVSKTRGPLPIGECVEYVLHACDAVAVAHSVGIIHRDLKPANLFLTHKLDGVPCVKVLDFGISKDVGGTSDGHTTGMIGSPIYMSPEQMMSAKNVDERTDIWSLGAILFRLVAAKPPYDAESIVQLAAKIATEAPRSLRSVRADVPPALETIVMKCLARDRENRFANIAELAAALAPFAPARAQAIIERITSISTRRRAPVASVPAEPPPTNDPTAMWATTQQMDERQGGTFLSQTSDIALPMRSRVPVFALLACVIVAGGIGSAVAVQRYRNAAPAAAAIAAPSGEPEPVGSTTPPTPSTTPPPQVSVAIAPSASQSAGAPTPKPATTTTTKRRGTSMQDAGSADPWGWER